MLCFNLCFVNCLIMLIKTKFLRLGTQYGMIEYLKLLHTLRVVERKHSLINTVILKRTLSNCYEILKKWFMSVYTYEVWKLLRHSCYCCMVQTPLSWYIEAPYLLSFIGAHNNYISYHNRNVICLWRMHLWVCRMDVCASGVFILFCRYHLW